VSDNPEDNTIAVTFRTIAAKEAAIYASPLQVIVGRGQHKKELEADLEDLVRLEDRWDIRNPIEGVEEIFTDDAKFITDLNELGTHAINSGPPSIAEQSLPDDDNFFVKIRITDSKIDHLDTANTRLLAYMRAEPGFTDTWKSQEKRMTERNDGQFSPARIYDSIKRKV
jgi:hypothetical protein